MIEVSHNAVLHNGVMLKNKNNMVLIRDLSPGFFIAIVKEPLGSKKKLIILTPVKKQISFMWMNEIFYSNGHGWEEENLGAM